MLLGTVFRPTVYSEYAFFLGTLLLGHQFWFFSHQQRMTPLPHFDVNRNILVLLAAYSIFGTSR
jgi:hypothetical protein